MAEQISEQQQMVYDKETDTWYYKDDAKNEITIKNKNSDYKPLRPNNSAFLDFFARMFDFVGVSTRREFWWPFIVFSMIWALLYSGVFYAHLITNHGDNGFVIFVFITFIILGIASLSAKVRRLHDSGVSGLLAYLSCAANLVAPFEKNGILWCVAIVIEILLFLGLISPSSYYDNKYYEEDKMALSGEKTKPVSTENTQNANNIDNIEKAYKLYKQKIITKAEFETIKKKALQQF